MSKSHAGTSNDLHEAAMDSGLSGFDDCRGFSPTPFPSLTGLRSQAISGKEDRIILGSGLKLTDLHSASNAIDVSPIAPLQLAWAAILYEYSDTKNDVAFHTFASQPEGGSGNDSEYKILQSIPTQIDIQCLQSSEQASIASVLYRVAKSNATAAGEQREKKRPISDGNPNLRHNTILNLVDIFQRTAYHEYHRESICSDQYHGSTVKIQVWPCDSGLLRFEAIFTDEYLDRNSARLMLEQLDDLLLHILRNSGQPFAHIFSAPHSSLRSVPNKVSGPFVSTGIDTSLLHSQFEAFAEDCPHELALLYIEDLKSSGSETNVSWTYQQLNQKAYDFAWYLNHQYGPLDEVIPICMERCPELYVAILGILKAGSAWCPIDASFPAQRRHDLIVRTEAKILVVAESKNAAEPDGIPSGVAILNMMHLNHSVRHEKQDTKPKVSPSSIAYLIWTSGTTGEPKGVPIHHEAAVSSMRSLQASIPAKTKEGTVRCLQFSQFTFDVFIQDLFYTWGLGGAVISSSKEIMLGSFSKLTTISRATHAHLTPAFAASVPRETCPTLEVITMIGEKLAQSVADDWCENMHAFNTYGPAEATVVSTFRRFGSLGDEIQSGNIGFPLPSVSISVMRNGRPVMKHGVGELAIAGIQLSNGYWRDPGQSSKRFVWNEEYSTWFYMTGDIVRQLHDGSLDFIGRTDDLIKIQGIRIELSEIAFALRDCDTNVEQIEIQYLERNDRPVKVIVAFLAAPELPSKANERIITSEEAIQIGRNSVRRAQQSLPEYMIPSVFLVIPKIPLTLSAKTDLAALKATYESADLVSWERDLIEGDSRSAGTATWTRDELFAINIIAELSGTSRHSISQASTLSSIGIDSITALRLVATFNVKGIPIQVADVLRSKNLGDLLNLCFPRWADSPSGHVKDYVSTNVFDREAFHNAWYGEVVAQVDRPEIFVMPTLPMQEAFLSESLQNSETYWSNYCWSLNANVDLDCLYSAWVQVIKSTEALRTGFVPIAKFAKSYTDSGMFNGTFLQLIYSVPLVDWKYIGLPESTFRDHAIGRLRAVAKIHQESQFENPPWAITIFTHEESRTMMLTVHHSIRDEPSLDFIIADLKQHYTKLTSQEFSSDSDVDRSAISQRHQFRDAVSAVLTAKDQPERDEVFWAENLSSFANVAEAGSWPDLTGSSPNVVSPTEPMLASSTYVQRLTVPYKQLRARAIELGASSAATVLQVAWGFLLAQYLETDKVVFGETWSLRNRLPSIGATVGPFLSVLPVPFHACGSPHDMLRSQSDFLKKAREHLLIHPRAVRKLLNRTEGQTLYPAIFNFIADQTIETPIDDQIPWTRTEDSFDPVVEHPIAVNITLSQDDALQFELFAQAQIIDQSHLELLTQQFDAIVRVILDFPDTSQEAIVSHCPMRLLSLTVAGPSPAVDRALTGQPTDWVDHYAGLHPHWPAARAFNHVEEDASASEEWTYSDLYRAYRRVATFIGHIGSSRHTIAVCMDRRLEAYAIILGIWHSGNVYLPIAEDLPGERKSFLIHDGAATLLFTTASLAASFPDTAKICLIICVDEPNYLKVPKNPRSSESKSLPHPRDAAYMLYTSGSTGLPKGVLVSRGNLCSFIEAQSEFARSVVNNSNQLAGKGRYLGLASRAFDVHILEMLMPWRLGMCAVTAPRVMLLDNLEMTLQKMKISHACFVPSLVDQASLEPAKLPDLLYLSVGGEPISKRVIDTWASAANAALVNAYGPTEMTIGCCFRKVSVETNIRNIGWPLANTTAHVLVPETTRYTLRGVSGELCLTGTLVANGYNNRPDAQGFVEDFSGTRMYRTGDRVRLMADGSLEFLGRNDDQTKVRGQRLELGEVSEAIQAIAPRILAVEKVKVATLVTQHPSLAISQLIAFLATPRSSLGKNGAMVPAVVNSNEQNLTAKLQEVLSHAREVLPAYMVPDHIISMTALPLIPASGKVDQKRLKALFSEIPLSHLISTSQMQLDNQRRSSNRETNPTEKIIRDCLVETLVIDQAAISPSSNILRLGIDSLSVISLTIRLQKKGFRCTVTDVLRNPSVEKLALLSCKTWDSDRVDERLREIRHVIANLELRFRDSNALGLDTRSISAVRPCLPLQESMVALSLNSKSETLYVNHVTLELSPQVNFDKLFRAWANVVAEHDILRTCFQEFEGKMVQIVLKYDESHSLDWREIVLDPVRGTSQLQDKVNEIGLDIMKNLAWKAPLRLVLMKSDPTRANSRLLVIIHHALYDDESFSMLLNELYSQYRTELPSQIHTPIDTLIDHVWSQDQDQSKDFWTEYLANYQSSRLSGTDGPTITKASMSAERTLTSRLSDLERFGYSVKGTLASAIQAVFGIALAQLLGKNDVVFGAVLSGRTLPIEAPHTILAPCITTIPQRVRLRGCHTNVLDILELVQRGFAESLEFQHTPLRHIHRWLQAKSPLFDCLFSYVRKKKVAPYSHLWRELGNSMPNEFPLSVEFEADYETDRMIFRCVSTSATEKAKFLLENIDLLLGALVRGESVSLQDLAIKSSYTEALAPTSHNWDEETWSSEELQMQEVISDISRVGLENIHKGSSFFGLGIDSISAIRFARRLRHLGMDCSSADVMRHSCIGELAMHVNSHRPQTLAASSSKCAALEQRVNRHLSSIPKLALEDTVSSVYICTPLQSSMLTQSLASDGRLYSHHYTFQLSTGTIPERLKQALELLVLNTEILRTTFHFSEADARWLAAVHQCNTFRWDHLSTSSVPELIASIKEKCVFKHEESFARPPWRLTTMKGVNQTVFVLSIHHSLYDGESLNVLLQDWKFVYEGKVLPSRSPFSEAARAIVEHGPKAEEFWVHKLHGFRSNLTKLSIADPGATATTEFTLGRSTESILTLCKEIGVTLHTTALLAFGKTLACRSGSRDVVFGHVVGGRSLEIPAADDIVGPLFNTVPFRLVFDKTYITNRVAANKIQKSAGESQPFQHVSLGKVQKAWRQQTGAPDAFLFDSLFVFQNNTRVEDSMSSRFWTPIDTGTAAIGTEYSLNLEFEQTESTVVSRLVSADPAIAQEQLSAWLEIFSQTFEDIIEHPDRSVIAFPEVLRGLPLSVSIDSGAAKPEQGDDKIKPGPDLEYIREVLSHVSRLSVEQIALNASIFSLGLDSIAAIKVAADCRKGGYNINVGDVLQGRSLRGICVRLREKQNAGTLPKQNVAYGIQGAMVSPYSKLRALGIVGAHEKDVEDVLPCLAGQLYHLAGWLKSGRTMYEAIFTYHCRNRLDAGLLKMAWRGLRERHSILRTLFVAVSSKEVVQVVLKLSAIKDEFFHCQEVTNPEADTMADVTKRRACRPFDLFSPSSRLCHVRGVQGDYLQVKLHHATYDAWTVPMLIADLMSLYRGVSMPPVPSVKNFIQHTFSISNADEHKDYWANSLRNCLPTILRSVSKTRSELSNTSCEKKPLLLAAPAAVSNLQELELTTCASGIALPTIVLLAFGRILARHTSLPNPIFGVYHTGRSAPLEGIEKLCAPCLNVLPLPVLNALDSDPLYATRRLQEDLAARVPYEQSNLGDVAEWVGGGEKPLFNTFINILRGHKNAGRRREPVEGEEEFWIQDQKGHTTLSTSVERNPGKTAIDGLDTSMLAEGNLYLDVCRSEGDDGLDIFVKCDGEIMDEMQVRGFVEEIGEEVGRIVEQMKKEDTG